MRTFTLGKALVLALLVAPVLAQAAGLGRLTVQSNIGHPLNAEIELVSVRGDEASALVARLASPDAYQQSNLQYNNSLTGIKLSVEKRGRETISASGKSALTIGSSVAEPRIIVSSRPRAWSRRSVAHRHP